MPGFAAHCLLAHRTLAAWEQRGQVPFSIENDDCLVAFLNGAVGPDMGLFSQPHALISDLAHYVQSADLCRALVRFAETEIELAYAWGWATHVLADAQFHVLVNRGAGELLNGDASCQVSFADDPVAHIRVEIGLDAFCFGQLQDSEPSTFPPALDERTIGFVAAAFDDTYGARVVGKDELLVAHRVCAGYSGGLQKLNGVLLAARRGQAMPRSLWPFYAFVYLPSKWFSNFRPSSVAYAACRPVEPAGWLETQWRAQVAAFPGEFLALVDVNLADLPNYNLDLGYVELVAEPYSLTTATFQRWQQRLKQEAGPVSPETPSP